MRLPSFELGYSAYETDEIANTSQDALFGAASLNRTESPRSSGVCTHQLYQGSIKMEITEGLKPSTLAFVGRRSIQLSYVTISCYKNKALPYQQDIHKTFCVRWD